MIMMNKNLMSMEIAWVDEKLFSCYIRVYQKISQYHQIIVHVHKSMQIYKPGFIFFCCVVFVHDMKQLLKINLTWIIFLLEQDDLENEKLHENSSFTLALKDERNFIKI